MRGTHTVDVRVPFVGRREELRRLAAFFSEGGAMTLVGPGGVGKSRLALEAATQWEELTRRSPVFVALAGIAPEAVAGTIARALGAPETFGQDEIDAAARALENDPRALVLDNCEDATGPVSAVVDRLRRIPGAVVLATSRARLRFPGENVLEVHPFDVRDGSLFFRARALNASVNVDIDGADAAVVRRIVESLDGLAIAIDLAAARLASLSVRELADELTHPRPYHFRASGSRDPRHWTLNHVVDWSVAKLEPSLQRTFALASRYAGSFAQADVDALDENGSLHGGALAALAEQSLIVNAPIDGKFTMLAPIRSVAGRRRAQLPDRTAIDERFALYMNALAKDLQERAKGPTPAELMPTLAERYEDLLGALQWALRAPETRLNEVFSVFWMLVTVWTDGGRFTEGLRWCERFVAASGVLDEGRRGLAYYSYLRVAFAAGDYRRMLELAPQLIGTFTIVNDRLGLARAYNALGVASLATGRFEEATTYGETALALYKSLSHDRGVATALINLGNIALEGRSDSASARARYLEALELGQRTGPESIVALAYGNLAEAAYAAHDLAEAERTAAAALERYERLGDRASSAWAHVSLARARLSRGDAAGAGAALDAAFSLLETHPHPAYVAAATEASARLLAARRDYRRAAVLAHAARRLRRDRFAPAFGHVFAEAEAEVGRIERALGRDEAGAAALEAAGLDLRYLPSIGRRALKQGAAS